MKDSQAAMAVDLLIAAAKRLNLTKRECIEIAHNTIEARWDTAPSVIGTPKGDTLRRCYNCSHTDVSCPSNNEHYCSEHDYDMWEPKTSVKGTR